MEQQRSADSAHWFEDAEFDACLLSTVSLRVKRRSLARPRRAADRRSSRLLSYLLPRDSSPPLVMNSLRGCSLPKHACLEQSGGRSRVVQHKHGRGLCVIDAAVNGFVEPCSHRLSSQLASPQATHRPSRGSSRIPAESPPAHRPSRARRAVSW